MFPMKTTKFSFCRNFVIIASVFVYIRLLDLLADHKDKSGKSGNVLINGAKRQSNYKSVVGYVVPAYSLTLRFSLLIMLFEPMHA